ncbi:4-amino-4-deoxy-L-arabinose-phosphoundecaprenol flippase subunit ArnE [Pragia fontium]|uniref:Probable 4-amino-4-deoxy-L-arabinose-phosphoundecaprenol flippase subunit ArnE n=2 Tax=Pragia fontium TaxID=82985 RepID=A0AAJ4WDR6_9GAMM|nr:4-amino-4-deoxy-L-arabinose-phosphoundecaprenol flippase subunit ArnE [Pragia fontium]AKJ43359.1 4-amino-4-deoxy-L-arabinose-phospho-UDP flippase [Pragia fontium]GKX64684.1 putative 4-amino-4-deoxy-L-arabinose-phosphoundecaprenol flippase subunit ArnE [Pragia fontium]SFD48920.1 undecaprenyl phosphate-alpha-L-ara4N flippase subunit ArnE [Pragia fontium DSM 5563 = ATCC 49100]VEJ56735.1 Undecaprenyl phosphate-aminoarabinose flippase subunit ArnE [Pragia fontium]
MSYLLLFIVSILTCCGQLSQKVAAQRWQSHPESSRLRVTLYWLFLSALLLGVAMLVWLRVLQLLPLSVAYPMISLNFVLVTLCARYVFGEPTDKQHWIGIGLIMLGIFLMSRGL